MVQRKRKTFQNGRQPQTQQGLKASKLFKEGESYLSSTGGTKKPIVLNKNNKEREIEIRGKSTNSKITERRESKNKKRVDTRKKLHEKVLSKIGGGVETKYQNNHPNLKRSEEKKVKR